MQKPAKDEKQKPIPFGQTYNEVDYNPRGIPRHKLTHNVFFSKKRYDIECLGQLSLTPDDVKAPIVYVSAKDHKIVIVDYESRKRKVLARLVKGHDAKVTAVRALSKTRMASADADGHVVIWDLTSKSILHKYDAHEDSIVSICVLDENEFVTAGLDKRIKYWHCDHKEYVDLLVTKHPIIALSVLSRDELLYAYREDNPEDQKESHVKLVVQKVVKGHYVENLTHGMSLPKCLFSLNNLISQMIIKPTSEMIFLALGKKNCTVHLSQHDKLCHSFYMGDIFMILPSGRIASFDKKWSDPTLTIYEDPITTHPISNNSR